VLKITILEGSKAMGLRLEGRISGPWVAELRRVWRRQATLLGEKRFSVDLCGVTHMSTEGIELLAEVYRKTAAKFLTNSPMTEYFAEKARHRDIGEREARNLKEN
jgi:ABC-type transporter Mla MlaB component